MAEILKQSKTFLVMLSQEELDVIAWALGARTGRDDASSRAMIAHELFMFLLPHRKVKGPQAVTGVWEFVP